MVWVISILLGIACVGFFIKAFDPDFGKKKRGPFLEGERARRFGVSQSSAADKEPQSVKKKATVRISLPPKPNDDKQTIRIMLPSVNESEDVQGLGVSQSSAADKEPQSVKKKATVRISLPPKPSDNKQTIRIQLPSANENTPEITGIKAQSQEPMPVHALPPRAEYLEEEYLGSSSIVIGPVVGRPYWLAGLDVIAIFEGSATTGSHFCFSCGGHSFYLDKASHCVRLPADRETHVVPVPVAVPHSSEVELAPRQSAKIKPPDIGSLDVVQRMRVLTYMYEELLISNEEYAKKKSAILDEI
jgi:hypothetical protein